MRTRLSRTALAFVLCAAPSLGFLPSRAEAQRPMAPVSFSKPNLFQLQGPGVHVTYSTSGIDGKPHFNYQDANGSQAFSGDQIKVEATAVGSLVTVWIRKTIDAGSTSFSVLIPSVNLSGTSDVAQIHSEGIATIHRFAIIPAFNHGQVEVYSATALSGTARLVAF